MILNLRGTHGSGKTWVSHKLIADYEMEPRIEPEYVLGKHFVKANVHVKDNLFIAGRYKSGMDGIFPQEIVEEMIRYWAPQGNVIWENVMVSANVGRWAELSKELEPINHAIWTFFDTPLQLCIDRVFERRAGADKRGFNHRQEDAEVKLDVLAGHWRRCRRAAVRAYQEGIDVRWINHELAYEQVHDLLFTEGSWKPSNFEDFFPNVPKQWKPTDEELEYVLKTAILPWEPTDTQTKVDFVSPPRASKLTPGLELGTKVEKWGSGIDDDNQLGVLISDWKAYHRMKDRQTANRIGDST